MKGKSTFIEIPKNVIIRIVDFFRVLNDDDLRDNNSSIESIPDFEDLLSDGDLDAQNLKKISTKIEVKTKNQVKSISGEKNNIARNKKVHDLEEKNR